MKHRNNNAVVDGPSNAIPPSGWSGPFHRAALTKEEVFKIVREELAFLSWCKAHSRDPIEVQSLLDYEMATGWLFLSNEASQ